ncbi:hypothetical protein GFS03_03955 [Sulfolobus sp. E5-1-F]|uniref:AAA domain-containing protein n=1 Tax=Saccharolobus sp. E5-1-F TaxID=2663019 RepID=UPI0012964F6E|nr:AAA domain-containing protein [Sulfolobus sp. E5-1-F]QGA53798.1 hypothetical protein GFS03_03955 [Sulfolobus sp. E5-1-F]
MRKHYRSNVKIINFVAKHVYNNEIVPDSRCFNLSLHIKSDFPLLDPLKQVVFVHVNGREVKVTENKVSKSLYNEMEIKAIKEIVPWLRGVEVGIISPYRAQRNRLVEELSDYDVEINTVDAFQGREKDVIIFSVTATTNDLKFATNKRRLNVAFTRARYKLIVLGNENSIRNLPNDNLLRNYVEYAYANNSVWAYEGGGFVLKNL